jgi:hypothetical protein
MKFKVFEFTSIQEAKLFLDVYIPHRVKEGEGLYLIDGNQAIVVSGKNVLFIYQSS